MHFPGSLVHSQEHSAKQNKSVTFSASPTKLKWMHSIHTTATWSHPIAGVKTYLNSLWWVFILGNTWSSFRSWATIRSYQTDSDQTESWTENGLKLCQLYRFVLTFTPVIILFMTKISFQMKQQRTQRTCKLQTDAFNFFGVRWSKLLFQCSAGVIVIYQNSSARKRGVCLCSCLFVCVPASNFTELLFKHSCLTHSELHLLISHSSGFMGAGCALNLADCVRTSLLGCRY